MEFNIKKVFFAVCFILIGLCASANTLVSDKDNFATNKENYKFTLKQKINQMFITGYKGSNPYRSRILKNLLSDGLGGVIFYSYNIKSEEQFIKSIQKIMNISLIPSFLSIDQEGGRVERTEKIHKGKKYKDAYFAAQEGENFLKKQEEELCSELKSYGINMNFAPVLDTNTNPDNPIIGVRAYGSTPEEVIKYGDIVRKVHEKHGIIPVGKHFPGHGDTKTDSHIEMPVVDIEENEFRNTHLKPFEYEIAQGIPAIMVSHVYYKCFDKEPIPASLSKNIIDSLLRKELDYKGLVISDDMVMGAVKDLDIKDSYIKGIKSGINIFIYKNSDRKLLKILKNIEKEAENDDELKEKIEKSFELILDIKRKYAIIK